MITWIFGERFIPILALLTVAALVYCGYGAGKDAGYYELLKKEQHCESRKIQGKEFKRCWAITELDQ